MDTHPIPRLILTFLTVRGMNPGQPGIRQGEESQERKKEILKKQAMLVARILEVYLSLFIIGWILPFTVHLFERVIAYPFRRLAFIF